MLMMCAPAVRIMRSQSRAEAASSNLLALHRVVQKLAPTPHGTRARFAAIHQLISSFLRAGDRAGARITSISGTPATQRRRVGGVGRPPLKASPLGLRQAPPRPRPQKGPAALPDLWLPPVPSTPKKTSSGAQQPGVCSSTVGNTAR